MRYFSEKKKIYITSFTIMLVKERGGVCLLRPAHTLQSYCFFFSLSMQIAFFLSLPRKIIDTT